MSRTLDSTMDPDNRDPMNINKHFQLDFVNVIGEPDKSSYSFESVNNVVRQVYFYSKLFIYRTLTLVLGIPLMLVWGLLFGIYTFAMIWIAVPIRRLIQSIISEFSIHIQTFSDAAIGPVFRSMGLLFSSIHISSQRTTV